MSANPAQPFAARHAAVSRIHTGGKSMASRKSERQSERSDQLGAAGLADGRPDRATRVWARNRLRELAESGKLGLSAGSASSRATDTASATR